MSKFKNPLNFFKKKEKKKEDEKVEEKKQKQEYDYSGTKIANGSSSEDENFKNLRDKIEEDKNKTEQTAKTEHTETEAPKNSGEKIEEKVSETSKENAEQTAKTEHTETEAPKNSGEKIEEKVNETSKENAEQTAKTEHTETETKPEAKNNENSEKMFEEMKALNEKIANLNDMFLKKIQSMEFEKNVVNDLHKELQGYKDDLYFKLIKPTLMDLIDMKNSFKRGIENFSQKTEAEKINFLETFIFEIDTILEKNDIEIYETDITNEQNFNVKKQKIIEKIETDKKENHGKVFKVKSNGYIYKGKVISPEKVEVYVYNEKSKEELKGE